MSGSADHASRRALRGAASALGAALLAALLWPAPAQARPDVFSPGELARSHSNLEGIKNCTKCHSAGEKLDADKCLACHKEIKARLDAGKGFHGLLKPAEKEACQRCHKDHQGRDFQMIDWEGTRETFDHKKTGWPLAGKHRRVQCLTCHEVRLVTDAAVKERMAKDKHATFLGLPTACAQCHFDEHRGQLGEASPDCKKCHVETGFKPAPGFDHAKSDFALTGKHQKVDCDKCHKKVLDAEGKGGFPAARSESFLRFKPIEHASCTACHKDPHEGRLGADCTRCHQTGGWQDLREGAAPAAGAAAFHDKTRFPLRGAHVQVACKVCHGPFPGEKAKFKGLQFERCSDCHLDAHAGQLARGPKAGDCDRCHTVDTFAAARFDLEEHAKARYPLEGAHRAVACLACHLRDEGMIKRVPAAALEALKKHRREPRVSPAVFLEKGDLKECRTCHADAHGGQFDARVAAEGCVACHSVETFHKPAFDHQKQSRFPLEGKHAEVECAKCHAAEAGKPVRARAPFEGKLVRYKPVDTRCAACHADPHGGQFDRVEAGCAGCHTTTDFKKTRFVHEPPFVDFRLEGKHRDVACAGCHPQLQLASGQKVAKYKGVPRACESCHDDIHKGAFRRFAQ